MSLDISPLKVMKSAAGYYVGRSYAETINGRKVDGFPYSRESGYFNTSKQAADYLDYLTDQGEI